jgi:CheY-like chemotaxis protein
MVYGFVRQSGGRIDVASRPQEGTTFTVDLPACDPVAIPSDIAPPASEAANPAAAPGGVRILVVEDDPGVRASIVDLLAGLGHRCDAVASGPEALARLAADAAFDLLITDLALDGATSGVDLIAALRVDHPALPVLVVTGYLGDAKPDRPVLTKPFRREDLAAAVVCALADAAPAAPRPASDPAPQA